MAEVQCDLQKYKSCQRHAWKRRNMQVKSVKSWLKKHVFYGTFECSCPLLEWSKLLLQNTTLLHNYILIFYAWRFGIVNMATFELEYFDVSVNNKSWFLICVYKNTLHIQCHILLKVDIWLAAGAEVKLGWFVLHILSYIKQRD